MVSLLLIPLLLIGNLVVLGLVIYWIVKIGIVLGVIIFFLWFGVGIDTINEFFEGVIIGLNSV